MGGRPSAAAATVAAAGCSPVSLLSAVATSVAVDAAAPTAEANCTCFLAAGTAVASAFAVAAALLALVCAMALPARARPSTCSNKSECEHRQRKHTNSKQLGAGSCLCLARLRWQLQWWFCSLSRCPALLVAAVLHAHCTAWPSWTKEYMCCAEDKTLPAAQPFFRMRRFLLCNKAKRKPTPVLHIESASLLASSVD